MPAHETRLISSDAATLWARRDGMPDQPAVLLIAGANACHLMWPDEFCQQLLDQGFSVIRYDHRDTGRSSRFAFEDRPYTVTTLAEDAVAVLDGFGIERAHVVGLSMGGTLVQVALIDHPERWLSATIMLTAALDVDFAGNLARVYDGRPEPMGLPLPRKEVLDLLGQARSENPSMAQELDRRVAEWLALSGRLADVDAAEFREWEARAIAHAGTVARPANHGLAPPVALSRGAELAQVEVPVLVIQGGEDPLNPPPHGRHLASLLANARLLEVPELGHSLPGSLHGRLVAAISAHMHGSKPTP